MESMSSKAPPVKVVRKQRQRIFEKGSYFFDKNSTQENMGEEENFDTGMVIDDVTRELLEGALSGFYFLQSNEGDKSKMDTLIRAMQKEELDKDSLLIVEGESGTKLFVVESGELEVSINGQVIRKMGKGVLLGELALLYDAPRTATVRCTTKCILWSLRREVFKKIQAYSSSDLDLQRSRWLINSHELAVLSALDMSRLIGALHTTHYQAGDVLYTEHEPTNQCILIEKGLAKVYVSKDPKGVVVEQVDNMLGITRPQGPSGAQSAGVSNRPNTAPKQPGGYFACDITTGCLLGIGILCGKANLAESWKWIGPQGAESPCTVIAQNDMTCLSFTVDVFENLFGPVDKVLQPRKRDIEQQNQVQEYCGRKFDSTKFKLKYVLGSGSFGIVTLAEYRENPQTVETFALKSLSKVAVIETGQLRHVLDERRLLGSMNSPFVLKLFGTYQTPHQLVMVTEPLNCGDLWCVIYETSPYSENEGISLALARTYAAILVLGLAHVHEQGVVYRDLKPENIMVDELGYLRIIDFGFAKKVPYTKVDSRGEMRVHPKTYTLCGTPGPGHNCFFCLETEFDRFILFPQNTCLPN